MDYEEDSQENQNMVRNSLLQKRQNPNYILYKSSEIFLVTELLVNENNKEYTFPFLNYFAR